MSASTSAMLYPAMNVSMIRSRWRGWTNSMPGKPRRTKRGFLRREIKQTTLQPSYNRRVKLQFALRPTWTCYQPCEEIPPSMISTLPVNNFTGSLSR